MRYYSIVVLATLTTSGLAQSGLTVHTKEGAVVGTLVDPGVRQFLGIPYAVAGRWKPPQPPPLRPTTFQATSFGASCVQLLSISNLEILKLVGLGTQDVQESEECLSANIWTPSLNRKQNASVMIWIYGGGFEFGTSNTTFYNGQTLVRNHDDVLVVSFNYRMTIFGFPNAPLLGDTHQSQNFGALDVEAAIEWVHLNIAAFGGDPNRITIFGQSAGAALASAYTIAHPNDVIVKGVIEESGSLAGMSPAVLTFGRPLNATRWNLVANAVGCGIAPTQAQLACMEKIPFGTLVDTVIKTNFAFLPVQDDITFFGDPTERSAAGHFLRVPLLVGNNAEEGDIFLVGLEQLGFGKHVPFNISDLVTELIFDCPVGTTAEDYVDIGVPVWRYRYEAVFPDISIVPKLRAFHASEIPIVFGTFRTSPFGPPPNVTETRLSRYVQGAWVAFARDPQDGLTDYGWPRYHPRTQSLARLGSVGNETGVVFSAGNLFDDNCLTDPFIAALVLEAITLLGIRV